MSSQLSITHSITHVNVMELLVAEEVEHQWQALPARLAQYLNRNEVETFALNRLPALYAVSQRGLQHQREKAQKQLQPQITQAVRQAFAAIQDDPLRASEPLPITASQQQAEAALAFLQQWTGTPDLTWGKALELLGELQRQHTQTAKEKIAASAAIAAPTRQPSTASTEKYSQRSSDLNSTALRPGIYGCRTAWIPRQAKARPQKQG